MAKFEVIDVSAALKPVRMAMVKEIDWADIYRQSILASWKAKRRELALMRRRGLR